MTFKTNSFNFETFDLNKNTHRDIYKILKEDELTTTFFKDWYDLVIFSNSETDIKTTNVFVVEKDNVQIGIITLSESNNKEAVFSHIILPNFRGQRYSKSIKEEALDYLFKEDIYDRIICYIDQNNNRSISSMLRTKPDNIELVNQKEPMYKVTYENKYNKESKNEKSR